MSQENSRPPLPTLLDVERAISTLRHAHAELDNQANPDRWARERYQSIERVLWWLELELGPLVAELGVPIAQQASLTQVPPIEGIRRVLLERISTAPASSSSLRNFSPTDLGELRARAPHGRCPKCNEALCHYTGPNAGGVLCPHCDADEVHELVERNGGDGNAPLCAQCGLPTNTIDSEGRCSDCRPLAVHVELPAGVQFDRVYVNRGDVAVHIHSAELGVLSTVPCPVCGAQGKRDARHLPTLQATCSACGWHYTDEPRRDGSIQESEADE